MSARHLILLCLLGVIPASGSNPGLTLAECYTQALAHDPEIQKARLEVERAAGTKLTFTARALPRLGVQAPVGVSDGNLYNGLGGFVFVRADVAQPLFDMGIPPALRRGNLEVVVAQQNLNRIVTDQLHATRLAFLRALFARALLDVQHQVQTHLESNLQRQQQRLTAGAVGKQNVRQAEIQLLNLKAELARVERESVNAVTELAEHTGQDLRQAPMPTGRLEYAPLPVDVTAETARALARRADLELLRALIRATAEDRQMIQAAYWPVVALTAFTQYIPRTIVLTRKPETVPGHDARITETWYGAALTWQIIDNGRVTGASRRVESGRQAYAIVLRQLEANVPRELAVLKGALETVDAKVTALQKSAQQAEELLKLVEATVELGSATQLDFLDAQTNLLATQAQLLQAVFENERARAEFDRLTGRYLTLGSDAAK